MNQRISVLSVLCLVLAGHAVAGTPQYVITDLGTLPGGSVSYGYAINNAGQVTGASYVSGGGYHVYLYSAGAGMTDMGTLGGPYGEGLALNNSGAVTGDSYLAGGGYHAFVSGSGSLTDLGTLGGAFSEGNGINNAGTVTGYAYVSGNSAAHAFVSSGGTMTDLGTLGGANSYGNAINTSGVITGNSYTSGGANHAFTYSNGTITDLGTLGGFSSIGYGINDSGLVTGQSNTASFATHAFVYANGTMTDLGTLGGNFSAGYGINNAGQVTGTSSTVSGVQHAFVTSGGTMYDLNDIVTNAAALHVSNIGESWTGAHINDWGQIAADATVNGTTHAVLLSPTTPLSTTLGSTLQTNLVSGMDYSLVTNWTNTGGLGTTVGVIGGAASTNQVITQTFASSTITGLASDALNFSGTGTDTFVLQMTYNEALANSLFNGEQNAYLGWLDPSDNTWKNAVLGNTGGTPTFINGAYDPATDFVLGYYGVDTVNNTVWAVINHNSEFGVFGDSAPEPGRALLLLAGLSAFALRRRR